MNYDPVRMTEELAKEQTQLMNFQNCDFHIKRSNKNDGIMNAVCSADKGTLEHNEDLLVTAYFHSDSFDKWLDIIQKRQNCRISLRIQFNQDARDLFLGSLMMNYLGDYDLANLNISATSQPPFYVIGEGDQKMEVWHPFLGSTEGTAFGQEILRACHAFVKARRKEGINEKQYLC